MNNRLRTRFAIIGCGNIANAHAQSIMDTEEAELVAVCDVNIETALAFAEKYGTFATDNLTEMLQRNDIDAVCICTPSGLHSEQTIMASQAGKHVMVEKPMAIRLSDIDRMITACNENDVLLGTILPRRMAPAAQFAKKFIAEGRLGKLNLCDAYVKIYRSQEYYDSAGWRGTWAMDGGGAMMNQGIHTIDLLQWLVGPVQTLYGMTINRLRHIEVEDTAISLLQFENGAIGTMEITTTVHPDFGQRLEIHGEKGTLIYTEDQITLLDVLGEQIELPTFEPFVVVPDGHRAQIRDMANAIREGRQLIVSGYEGRHSLEIILGTYESSKQKQEVRLSDLIY